MSLIDIKNRVQCLTTEDITSTQTRIPVGPGSADFAPATGERTLAVLRDAVGAEVVSIISVSVGTLDVERGVDGSVARAFKSGALVSLRLVKGSFAQFMQQGVMRQVSYNPNKVLIPAYFGEKVSEIGIDGCTHRIWQNVIDKASCWRIVYGDICPDFTNWRDWDWCIFNIDWANWPDIVVSPPYQDGTGFDPELMSLIFSDENSLYSFYSASFVSIVSGSVASIKDNSDSGLDAPMGGS